ncbi:phosphoribosylglycinamide formyltransferase [Vibrio sp. SS-MA-C1-2]|uniref:phosphoribosylglycinamide formyltransferase n=1 Tax=Vibrio sp. SS-MA-C1-2 TaxID=2908646 RepID=UPI001F2DF7FF|nr:phosphoribosylglycinamide formyltransferase [Vibrio sp. SS-MA-C1-2]UJF19777.1 phosphoribosylglycinamide formyltransferase [Vibrio sp. SS-MA-C1-2]
MKKIVVLISGGGSNLQSIIDHQASGKIDGEICAVISNKSDAYGLERAKKAGIATHVLTRDDYSDRQAYDAELLSLIKQQQPQLIVLAGFMLILPPVIVEAFEGRILNIHPSLLPKYPGLNTYQRAIEAGDKEHGTSVHFVNQELDAGAVILQAKVPIFDDDTLEEIQTRVQHQEHLIYPLVVSWFMAGRLICENGYAVLDEKILPENGYAD